MPGEDWSRPYAGQYSPLEQLDRHRRGHERERCERRAELHKLFEGAGCEDAAGAVSDDVQLPVAAVGGSQLRQGVPGLRDQDLHGAAPVRAGRRQPGVLLHLVPHGCPRPADRQLERPFPAAQVLNGGCATHPFMAPRADDPS